MILPDPLNSALFKEIAGLDQDGQAIKAQIIHERPLTIFLNSQEIVTAMTIGDYPEYLAVGYLLNQNMLDAKPSQIEYHQDIQTVVVRTPSPTCHEEKLRKKTQTSGCAQGTVFGDIMEGLEKVSLPPLPVLDKGTIIDLIKNINAVDNLYQQTGAIHACVLCQDTKPVIYMEDVGRHNALDKIAGVMFLKEIPAAEKIIYTTGRLTSEMVIKTAKMGISTLVSCSGFTNWGVELARKLGLTLIGRAKGSRFLILAGDKRFNFNA